MKEIVKLKAMSTGIDDKLTNELEFCDSCTMAKQSRLSFNGTRRRATRTLELVHTDVCGKI